MSRPDKIRAVVVKLNEEEYPERPWIACSMSLGTYELIDEHEWQQWKQKALELCLADWRSYEIREVTLNVPQDSLDAMFAVQAIDATMEG